MTADTKPLGFGHHALAILASATAGATFMSIVFAIVALAGERGIPGSMWLAMMTSLVWLSTFLLALPAAGLIFSVIFPITRKLTPPSRVICILVGAIAGLILAPAASYGKGVVTWSQLLTFAAVGIVVAGAYLTTGLRLAPDRAARTPLGGAISDGEAGAAAGIA